MKVILPDYLREFKKEAAEIIKNHSIKDIEFSGATYQILVEDPISHEEYWVFMQLDGKGDIKDAFCSCENIPDHTGCLHAAGAYLSLFKQFSQPLHLRFARSLWNQLCRLYEERLGDDPQTLSKLDEGHFACHSRLGKIIFSVKGLKEETRHALDKILFKRENETEETSLKFSNLSSEEIISWREGKPNPQLRFDLSFWSDLAKWLMKKQEDGEKYQLTFRYSKKNLPNWLQIEFEDVVVGFYLSAANLPLIIESLKTVKSPLSVYHAHQKEIGKIIYDKHEQVLHIIEQSEEETSKRKKNKGFNPHLGIALDGWLFVPGDGFYAEETHELLKNPILHGEDIVQALSDHTRLISSLIAGCIVHREPVSLSYHLHFDQKWNLHVHAYLFTLGDLDEGDSWLIENWAYLDDDGFYPVEGNRFESIETFIPFLQVSDFVTNNRAWLNTQEGFHTHVRSIEYQLSYQLTQNRRLIFTRNITKSNEDAKQQDFGVWVYLEGFGFYSKTAGSFNYLLKSGVSLSPEQIPLFIKMNYDELSLIPKFFSDRCPVEKAGLRITLSERKKVLVSPEYHLLQAFQGKEPLIFDDFIYLEGEGFYELPKELRLPDKFRTVVELEGEELVIFLSYELESLMENVLELDPKLIKPQQFRLVTNFIEPALDKGRGWYNFRLFYQTESGQIPLHAIRQAMNKKFPFAFFQAGMIDLRDRQFEWIKLLNKERFEKGSDKVLLSTLDYLKLNAFDPIELLKEGLADELSAAAIVLDELNHLQTPIEPNIEGLISSLRPYQEIGVHWLWFLYSQQLSGLLCDDMGLGKTHQAMALLTSVKNFYHTFAEGTACHFLIVCPTSVIYHWQEKVQQFLPRLRVCTFYGSKRTLEQFSEEYDILLTSYGVLRNEKELLAKIPFEVAVLDEIQVAKNQYSRVYAALRQINAQMKLGLTGTPIENHLRELKSLFDIILPTYMPGEQDYRDFFVKPIEKEHNPQRKALLNRLIKPFILRRKKDEVLKDLPEKIEEIAYCDLTPNQVQLYSEVLQQRRHHLIEELKEGQNAIPYLHIFALLSSLKQICNHPAVYLKAPADYKKYNSGKWNLFLELFREACDSEQKVVIFSQYLGMLDIIEFYLQEQGIGYASLRGSTRNRKEELALFNNDPDCRVFIGSLHAAGLGVDLTAGSVVIHYDRWWNAARENQATDRVHRIGQTRGVQVFKLVTKGTFEEKIDEMILRKGRLLEDIVGVDDQNTLKTFTRDELMELLDFAKIDHEIISDTDNI